MKPNDMSNMFSKDFTQSIICQIYFQKILPNHMFLKRFIPPNHMFLKRFVPPNHKCSTLAELERCLAFDALALLGGNEYLVQVVLNSFHNTIRNVSHIFWVFGKIFFCGFGMSIWFRWSQLFPQYY